MFNILFSQGSQEKKCKMPLFNTNKAEISIYINGEHDYIPFSLTMRDTPRAK